MQSVYVLDAHLLTIFFFFALSCSVAAIGVSFTGNYVLFPLWLAGVVV